MDNSAHYILRRKTRPSKHSFTRSVISIRRRSHRWSSNSSKNVHAAR